MTELDRTPVDTRPKPNPRAALDEHIAKSLFPDLQGGEGRSWFALVPGVGAIIQSHFMV